MPGASIDVLMRVPLFADLEPDELQLLADSMQEHTFTAGEAATTEGGAADGFFVIQSGEAEVTVQGESRGTMTAGDYFGEVAMLIGSQRTATITARTDLQCYGLSPEAFRTIVEGNPSIALKVMQSMSERLS